MSQSINTEATAAYAEPVTDWTQEERFIYHAGEEGITLNEEATADAIEKALEQGEFVCTVEATVNAVLPGGNIDDLKAATSFIASYTTKFSARRDDEVKQNRKFNIQKAVGHNKRQHHPARRGMELQYGCRPAHIRARLEGRKRHKRRQGIHHSGRRRHMPGIHNAL